MVKMKTSHVILIEPRQYLILHFFPSSSQSQILPGMFMLIISPILINFFFLSLLIIQLSLINFPSYIMYFFSNIYISVCFFCVYNSENKVNLNLVRTLCKIL
ncbi:hypothetical protein AAZV13_12G088900 [Glycine max]